MANELVARYRDCVRLNWNALLLALQGRWLTKSDLSDSYDRIAETYDSRWLEQLKPVTLGLLEHIPAFGPGTVLDLGCGTGFSTSYLAKQAKGPVMGVDISNGMLDKARAAPGAGKISYVQADMLRFLKRQATGSASLIFSGWAIGYSKPGQVTKQAARVLCPGGVFAFVVNLADSLAPVFRAYRKCMARHPKQLARVMLPSFPSSHALMLGLLNKHGFYLEHEQEGLQAILPPDDAPNLRDWLLGTGVLAGFDIMLPLHGQGEVGQSFEHFLKEDEQPIQHHYSLAVARLSESPA